MEARLSNPRNEASTLGTERLMDDFRLVAQRAGQKARESVQAADKVVRDNPYKTIGITLCAGMLIGALAHRWWFGRA